MVRPQFLSASLFLCFTAVYAANPLFEGYTTRCQSCLDDMHSACSRTSNIAECICMVDGSEAAVGCANGVCLGDSKDCSDRFKLQWQAYCLKELPQYYGSLVTARPTALPTCAPATGSPSGTGSPTNATTPRTTTPSFTTPTPRSTSSSSEEEEEEESSTSSETPRARTTSSSSASTTGSSPTTRPATTSSSPTAVANSSSAAHIAKRESLAFGSIGFVIPFSIAVGYAVLARRAFI